ncbi:hypothetical protein [Candidatus Cryosericum septentrionale]|jgi:hypothetical protein|nr:hypothetical protein [Candidatus Cryosericum septentrionale]
MIPRLMNLVAPKVNILGGLLGFPLQLLLGEALFILYDVAL